MEETPATYICVSRGYYSTAETLLRVTPEGRLSASVANNTVVPKSRSKTSVKMVIEQRSALIPVNRRYIL